MKKSASFPAPILLGSGLLVGVLLTVLTYNSYGFNGKNAQTTPAQLSSFELHYVNAGHIFARIPHKFCKLDRAEDNFTNECGPIQSFQEVDLRQHALPVDRIQSAVTDGNGKIVYAALPGYKMDNGCTVPDLFVYELATKQTTKLKNHASMWHCGAASSALSSLSQGGKYLTVLATGPSEAGGHWVYDIEQDRLDQELSGSRIATIFSLGTDTANDDSYALYVKGCSDGLIDPNGIGEQCVNSPMIKLRDNASGKIVNLASLEQELIRNGIDLHEIEDVQYSMATGELSFTTNAVDKRLTIKNFNTEVVRLVN